VTPQKMRFAKLDDNGSFRAACASRAQTIKKGRSGGGIRIALGAAGKSL
jgi:hypothetical protein